LNIKTTIQMNKKNLTKSV